MREREPQVNTFDTREEMGAAAAQAVHRVLGSVLKTRPVARVVFAAAPSQIEFLTACVAMKDVPWDRIVGLHMDEYFGLPRDAPQSFGVFLRTHLFGRVPFGRVEYMDSTTTDPETECQRYAGLISEAPVDLVCMGIGENGHIAFNDPPVADFADPLVVKIAELDERCRQQQVNDGCFPTIAEVPRRAMTLTIPALLSASKIVAVVPGPQKAQAVHDALRGPVTTSCPASVLRRHPDVQIFLDRQSASLLGE
jgi:glucosamine-6-phosphate deaminase